jgi:hypothetical protein
MLFRWIKLVFADKIEAASLAWQVFDPGTEKLAPGVAKGLGRSGLPWTDRDHVVSLADEPHGIFEFVSSFGADEEYILRWVYRHKDGTAAV